MHSIEEALEEAEQIKDRAYVIGGQSIYEQTIELAETDSLDITRVHVNVRGDSYFPVSKMNNFLISQLSRISFSKLPISTLLHSCN